VTRGGAGKAGFYEGKNTQVFNSLFNMFYSIENTRKIPKNQTICLIIESRKE
jgi:hypothetical protein